MVVLIVTYAVSNVRAGMRGDFRMILCVLALAGLASCASSEVSDQTEPSVVDFSWSYCASPETPFYSVHTASNGTLRYEGGKASKTLGIHEETISKQAVRSLESYAKAVIRKRAGKAASESDRGKKKLNALDVCLTVTRNGERIVVDLAAPSAKHFISRADQLTGFKKRLCPMRGWTAHYTGVCEREVIRYSFESTKPCPSLHWVLVYGNGDVQHTNNAGAFNDYFVISTADVTALGQMARKFEVVGYPGISEREGKPRLVRGSDAEVSQFREALRNLSGIDWSRQYDESEVCVPYSHDPQAFRGIEVNEAVLPADNGK